MAEPLSESSGEAGAPPEVTIGGYRPLSQVTHTPHGALYRARRGDGPAVFLKAVKPCASSAAMLDRFDACAEAVAKAKHANVCRLIEHGTDEATGLRFAAYEAAGTETLKDIVEERGRLSESEAAAIAVQIANAMDCIYGLKLIHGDVKPSHIVVARGGVAQLGMLGVAEPVADATVGTGESARFMSPEVTTSSEVDIRADMYSLGAVIYYMLTGAAPFADKSPKIAVEAHKAGSATWPEDVARATSDGLLRVAARMMAKSPKERYRTPTELVLDLHIVKEGQQPIIAASAPSQSTVAAPEAGGGARRAVKRSTGTATKIKAKRVTGGTTKGGRVVRGEAPRRGTNLKLVAAGTGGLVVLLIGLALILGGGAPEPGAENMPMPTKGGVPPPRAVVVPSVAPSPAEANDGPLAGQSAPDTDGEDAQALFDETKAYAKGKADDYAGILKRYQRCRVLAGNTPLGELIDAEVSNVTARRLEAADAAFEKASRLSRARAREDNYDHAIKAFDDVPEALTAVLPERFASEIARVKKNGDEKVSSSLAKVSAHLDAGDTAAARIELAALDSIRHASGRKVHAAREQALLKRVRDVEQEKREAASASARKELPGLLAKFDAFVDEGEYGSAHGLMETEMQRRDLVPVVGTLGAARNVAAALMERAGAMREAASKLVGKSAELRTRKGMRKGAVTDVVAGGIVLEIPMIVNGKVAGNTRTTIAWRDLGDEEQARLLVEYEAEDPSSLAVGMAMVALAMGDEAAAGTELGRAGEHQFAPHVRSRIEALKVGEEDAKAAALWRLVEADLARGRPSAYQIRRLGKLIDEFESKYGKSHFAHELGDKLLAAKERLARLDTSRARPMRIPGDAKAFGGNKYRVFTEALPWEQARLACLKLGGHLVSIGSALENQLLSSFAGEGRAEVWVGLTDQHCLGCWAWVSGEDFAFATWAHGEPDNAGQAERVVAVTAAGVWHDRRPNAPRCYVCEWETDKRRGADARAVGLLGTYFATPDLKQPTVRRLDRQVSFKWLSKRPDEAFEEGRPFGASWSGYLVPEVSGTYVISGHADDHFRIVLAGKTIVDHWTGRPGTVPSKPLPLEAGSAYPIRFDFKDIGGGAGARLMWRMGEARDAVIPPQCLRPPKNYAKLPGPPIRRPALELPDPE